MRGVPPAAPAALGRATGPAPRPAQVWRAKAGRRFTGRLVVAGETLYGGGVDRKVYAVDLASGQPRWSSRLGGLIGGGVLVAGDTVYAASSRPEGKVYALDAPDRPPICGGRRPGRSARRWPWWGLLVAETQRGEMLGLDPRAGHRRWRRRSGVSRIPAVAGRQRQLILATVDSLFRMTPGWQGRAPGSRRPAAIVSPWIEHRRTARGRDHRLAVVAIDPDRAPPPLAVRLDAPVLDSPAAMGDTLYAASRRGTLYRILPARPSRATPIVELDWPVTAPVTVVDGLILLGGADGTIRALEPTAPRPGGSSSGGPSSSAPCAGRWPPGGRRRRRPPPVSPMIASRASSAARVTSPPRPRRSVASPLVKYGKWVLAAGAVGMNYVASRAHEQADDAFDALETRCFDDRCALVARRSGRYLDGGSERLYQISLRYDRRARSWLFGGETALVGAAACSSGSSLATPPSPTTFRSSPRCGACARRPGWGCGSRF